MNPLVSVVLPLYNGEAYILQTIESIIGQTYKNWELLIIDDGSTDKSLDLVDHLEDPRVRIIPLGRNHGIVYALNTGIKLAKGKYIARIDADDLCEPLRFFEQVSALEEDPTVVCVGTAAFIIDSFGELTGNTITRPFCDQDIKASLFLGCPFIHPSIMLRKDILIENNVFYDSRVEYAQDYVLYSLLYKFGTMRNLQIPLIRYRIHNNSARITADHNKEKIKAGRFLAWSNILNDINLQPSIRLFEIHDKVCYYPSTLTHSESEFFTSYIMFMLKVYKGFLNSNISVEPNIHFFYASHLEKLLVHPFLTIHKGFKLYQLCRTAGLPVNFIRIISLRIKSFAKNLIKFKYN